MKLRFEAAWVAVAAFALAVTACGGDDDGAAGAGNGGSGGGSAGAGGASGQTIKVGATFLDYMTQSPIEALQVCTLIPEGRDPGCAETIATGQIVAEGFPMNSEVLFKLTKDDYFPTLIPAVTADHDDTSSTIYPTKKSNVDLLFSSSSLTREPGKGIISFIANQAKPGAAEDADGQPDVGVTIAPAGGTTAYMNGAMFDTTATGTSVSGLGIIFNLDPGDYTLTFTHASHTCTTRLGWTTSEANESKVPVQADTITYVLQQCGD